jgi:hypothetical protein
MAYIRVGMKEHRGFTRTMENVNIAILPALSESFLQLQFYTATIPFQAQRFTLHPSMALHTLFIVEATKLLPDVYKLAWKSLRTVQSQLQMSRNNNLPSSSGEGRRHASPDPEPGPPAAPPYVLALLLTFESNIAYTRMSSRVSSRQYIMSF